MRTYVTFLVSGTLTLLAFGATMFVQGGWQSALAAFAVLTGAGFLTSFILLITTGERLPSPAPRLARGRAIAAQRAPAVERRREPAPKTVAEFRPAPTGPRPRGRLSSAPS
jgi:hypothetical protein